MTYTDHRKDIGYSASIPRKTPGCAMLRVSNCAAKATWLATATNDATSTPTGVSGLDVTTLTPVPHNDDDGDDDYSDDDDEADAVRG